MVAVPDWIPLGQLAVAIAVAIAVATVVHLDRPDGRWGATLRRRFLAGVPWGTLVTAVGVLVVYLVLQGGLTNWREPVVVPYRAWSYFYPLGMVTAAFTHSSPGHLVGNLVGTLTIAPIAEYAWGHFPRERGSSSFGSWRTNPYVRAFLVVPGAAFAVGLLTALFSIGPIIGFSGVVFAFAGFALVQYPLATALSLLVGDVAQIVYATLRVPTLTAEARPVFSTPWWADVAIQGHAIGLSIGILLGVWYLRRQGRRASALRLWTGVTLFAFEQALWAVYWFRGNQEFVLYRAVGVGLVVLLASVVAVAGSASSRPLLSAATPGAALRATPRWQVAAVVLLLGAAAISGPAVPINLMTTSSDQLPGETVEVRGYEVIYAENVTNGMVSAIEVSGFGESTNVTTSGVIVRNPDRNIWTTAVSTGRLAFAGVARVRLGGVGWRETLVVRRDGWTTTGGNTTYRVLLDDRPARKVLFTAPRARAEPVIAGRTIAIEAEPEGYAVAVTRGNVTARAPLPASNESVTVQGISFARRQSRLVAVQGETRVTVATEETYPGQR